MYPTVEFGAGKYLVVWQESNQSNEFTVHLYGAFVDSSGVSGSFPICTSNGPKGAWGGLSLAFNGEKFLAAWTDYRTNNIQIYGTRITPSGVLLDGPPDIGGILISSYGDSPRVVANGSTWMVSWRAGKVYGARINADGSKYDTSSIPLSKDSYFWCYPDGLATDGVNYLVAWAASTANNAPHYLYAQLVGPVEPLNRPPVANAGADQSAHAGQKVTLNGSQSYDPDGDPLSYNWSFGSRPPNSNAVLINPNSVNPSFTPDLPGYYVVQLVVSDSHGATSAIDTVTISTGNTKPVAKAENQVIEVVNTKVTLDGSKSTDADNDPLTFTWTLVSRPDGSNAALNGTDQICPTFTADVHGTYRAQLVVSDPWTSSDPVVIEVTFTNVAPVANAGPDQSIDKIDVIVTLDGTGSTDANGDKLNYLWSVTKPDGLLAQLSDPSAVNPTFKADVHGTYVAQLTVSDGFSGTHTDTVTISFTNVSPVAEAGPNQSVQSYNTTVTLDGSQSYDANGDVLTYVWSFMNKPGESLATLTGADTEKPSFKADVHGDYVVQLTVSDGFGGTANDTVTVSFNNLPPTASAVGGGAYSVGQTVTLDGITSTDPNNDPLIYKWSLRSAPSGSAAVIAAPSASATSLTLDAKGQYEVQLVVNDGVVDSPPATVLITATLSTQAVIVAIQDLQQVTIGNLDPTVFKNSNMKNAMINKLSSVAANIEAGQYQEALGQLQHDLLAKTDGCATSGAPDKNDWIKSCENQAAVYQELQKIITMLQQLQ
jgi:PKD repeat protein